MTPRPLVLAALSVCALAAAASAQDAVAPKQDKKGFYRVAGRSWAETDAVKRKSISTDITIDGESRWAVCMVPPAADWVLDSQDEQLEKNYLHLVAIIQMMDATALHDKDEGTDKDDHRLSDNPEDRFIEANSGVVGFCGSLRSPTGRVDLKRVDAMWWDRCKNPVEAQEIGRYSCTAYQGGRVYPPMLPIVQTLKVLAKSPHEKTAILAMSLMEEIKNRKPLFAKTVSEVLLDQKTPLPARERAAEVLASLHTADLSADTLASLWGTASTPESLRRAALRGFSLVLSFGDQRMTGNLNDQRQCSASGRACERLRKYLRPLMGIVKQETIEDKKTGKDTLTPLGEAASCVASQYSRRWMCYAKRNGDAWYEKLKADEAKGLDECEPDGKLKK